MNNLKDFNLLMVLTIAMVSIALIADLKTGIAVGLVFPASLIIVRIVRTSLWSLTIEELKGFASILRVNSNMTAAGTIIDTLRYNVPELKDVLTDPYKYVEEGDFISAINYLKPISFLFIVLGLVVYLNTPSIANVAMGLHATESDVLYLTAVIKLMSLFCLAVPVASSIVQSKIHYRRARLVKYFLSYRDSDPMRNWEVGVKDQGAPSNGYYIDLAVFNEYITPDIEKELVIVLADYHVNTIPWDGKTYDNFCEHALKQVAEWRKEGNTAVWLINIKEKDIVGHQCSINRYIECKNYPYKLSYAQKAMVYAVMRSVNEIDSYTEFNGIYYRLGKIEIEHVWVLQDRILFRKSIHRDGCIVCH